jgi:periplasmic protein TonB
MNDHAFHFKKAVMISLLLHGVMATIALHVGLGPVPNDSRAGDGTLIIVTIPGDPVNPSQEILEEGPPAPQIVEHREEESAVATVPPKQSTPLPPPPEVLSAKPPLIETEALIPASALPAEKPADIQAASPNPPGPAAEAKPLPASAGGTPELVAAEGTERASQPGYLFAPKPKYPKEARRRKQEGLVLISAEINSAGDPTSVRVESSSGYGLLDRAALETIGTWRFTAATLNHTSVLSLVEIPVRFQLRER